MMQLNSPILIRDFEEFEICLDAAEALGVIVNCVTPPDVTWMAGPLYWQSMVEDVRESRPGTGFRLIVDCGEDAGLAMKAFATGLQYLLFYGDEEVAVSLGQIAESYEGHLVTIVGEGFDLSTADDKADAALQWLSEYASPVSAVR